MPILSTTNPAANYREWGNAECLGGSGENPTIVVLHGWGVDSSQYEKFGLLLAEKGYHVIVPDLPGWGKTPAPEVAWSVNEYVAWVREFVKMIGIVAPSPVLADILSRGERNTNPIPSPRGRGEGEGQFTLFGHSFGGRIAIKYAEKYPEDLRALILCAAAGIKMPETLLKRGLKLLAKIGKGVFRLPLLNMLDMQARKLLYRLAGSYDYMNAKGVMVEVLVKAVEEDLTPLLPQIKVPTLLLWGTNDRATPYKDGQTMARLIPGAKLITFEGERHNLPKHIPERLVTAIKSFLDNTNIL